MLFVRTVICDKVKHLVVHGGAFLNVLKMENQFDDFYKEIEEYYNVELRRNVRKDWEEYWAWFVAYFFIIFYFLTLQYTTL